MAKVEPCVSYVTSLALDGKLGFQYQKLFNYYSVPLSRSQVQLDSC